MVEEMWCQTKRLFDGTINVKNKAHTLTDIYTF